MYFYWNYNNFENWIKANLVEILTYVTRLFFHHHHVFCPRAGPSLLAQEPRLQFCWRQIFHHKLRNQGCSFTGVWISAVVSRYFPHPTLSSASEQTLEVWKDPRGSNVEARRVNLANRALQTSPKFTTGVEYRFHQGFWPYQRSGNPNHPSPLFFS